MEWFGLGPVTEAEKRQARILLAHQARIRKRYKVTAFSHTLTRALRRVSSGKVKRSVDAASYLHEGRLQLEATAVLVGLKRLFR